MIFQVYWIHDNCKGICFKYEKRIVLLQIKTTNSSETYIDSIRRGKKINILMKIEQSYQNYLLYIKQFARGTQHSCYHRTNINLKILENFNTHKYTFTHKSFIK